MPRPTVLDFGLWRRRGAGAFKAGSRKPVQRPPQVRRRLRPAQGLDDPPPGVEDDGGGEAAEAVAGAVDPVRVGEDREGPAVLADEVAGRRRPGRCSRRRPGAPRRAASGSNRSSSGASSRQGSHQLAQKLTSAGLPRRPASVFFGACRTAAGSGGAGFAFVRPSRRTATSKAISPATRPLRGSGTRRAAPGLRCSRRGTSWTIWDGVEVGRVEGRDLAVGGDPVDQRRVLDQVAAGLVGLGDDVPVGPDVAEFGCGCRSGTASGRSSRVRRGRP